MTLKEAISICGPLGKPSKMPGFSYGIPAQECNIGKKLRNVENSVCNKCYALKGFYVFRKVKEGLYKRLESIKNPRWVEAISFLIKKNNKSGCRYFRWHDSGDLQDIEHLEKIVKVCNNTPNIKHWLPTREYEIVRKFVENGGVIPTNLTIRLSAYMIDGPIPKKLAEKLGVLTSSVTKTDNFTCPASQQENECKNCRACWDKRHKNIVYKKH